MWKKPEASETASASSPSSNRPAEPPSRRPNDRAVIGPSISIRGDVTGKEDLLIQGKVEGKVDLQQNNVTIGEHGKIQADLFGRSLIVEGTVNGNLYGEERVVVRTSGTVIGNITSPRVHLEDGATFKGNIDMDSKGGGPKGSTSGSGQEARGKPETPAPSKLADREA